MRERKDFFHIAQVNLELLGSNNPSVSDLQLSGTINVCQHIQGKIQFSECLLEFIMGCFAKRRGLADETSSLPQMQNEPTCKESTW